MTQAKDNALPSELAGNVKKGMAKGRWRGRRWQQSAEVQPAAEIRADPHGLLFSAEKDEYYGMTGETRGSPTGTQRGLRMGSWGGGEDEAGFWGTQEVQPAPEIWADPQQGWFADLSRRGRVLWV